MISPLNGIIHQSLNPDWLLGIVHDTSTTTVLQEVQGVKAFFNNYVTSLYNKKILSNIAGIVISQ